MLCVLLGLAAVGCAVWALSAQSDADDAKEQLAAQEQAAQQADTGDEGLQEQLDQVAAELGTAGESVDEVQGQIEAAKARFDEAAAARADAASAVEGARAELEAFRAKADLAASCLRATFESVSSALDSGGSEAAVAQLEQLAGDCRAAVASE